MKKAQFTTFALTACFALAVPAISEGAPITIQNFSFELPDKAPGTFQTGSIPNWTNLVGGGFGVFNAGDFGQGGAATDGSQVAFFEGNGGKTVGQVLATNFAASTDYTLKIDMAKRDNTPGATTIVQVILYHSGDVSNVVKSLNVSGADVTADVFNEFTFTATAADISSASAIGQTIGIAFKGTGTVNQPIDMDNVRLDSALVPEPGSLALLGLGGLLVASRRRRVY